jgi:hypothetical protein
MPKLCASWSVQGREEKDYTEGLKTKYGKGQAIDTNGVTLRVGVETPLNDRRGRGHASGHWSAIRVVQDWKVSIFFYFSLLLCRYGPMADIPRNKVCAFENITAIHCIRQRQGKRFHTVPNATIFDL